MDGGLLQCCGSLIAILTSPIYNRFDLHAIQAAVFFSVLISIVFAMLWIKEADFVSTQNLENIYELCIIRTVLSIESPLQQNVSNIVSTSTCYYNKLLPNKLFIGAQPVVSPVTQGLTVGFSILSFYFVGALVNAPYA